MAGVLKSIGRGGGGEFQIQMGVGPLIGQG